MNDIKGGMKAALPRGVYERLREAGRRTVGPLLSENYASRIKFFNYAFLSLSFNNIDGDYFEFGCHGCSTFRMAWRMSRRWGRYCNLYAFDSFQGLPPQSGSQDQHKQWTPGWMSTSVEDFNYLCKI